ncbi:MAG: glycosyltransferase family 2 protein [Acidobacteriaceae bacterium]|nr:glycosyltransferase family 2 protein [Acidobacteriaceae bacterium]
MTDSAAVTDQSKLLLSVIIPARNEEASLGECLKSLAVQSDEGFALGREWELICVDDGSTDDTAAIAKSVAGVELMTAPPPAKGWMGKNAALWFAVGQARGAFILFTDADTVHESGSLRRALHERERHAAAMLSYSPRQIVMGFWQRALMPLVFSELAVAFPPAKASDPASPIAAANGQFLLVEREAYFQMGGHSAVAGEVLEDVALAKRFKRAGKLVRFRYAPDQVAAQMYRSFGAMVEGWTKNLALLFPLPLLLALMRGLDAALIVGLPLLLWVLPHLALVLWWPHLALVLLWLHVLRRYFVRVAKSNFPALDCVLSVAGVPLFCALLVRSWLHHTLRRRVSWKGREYPTDSPKARV